MASELKDDEDNGQKFGESHFEFEGKVFYFGCHKRLEDVF